MQKNPETQILAFVSKATELTEASSSGWNVANKIFPENFPIPGNAPVIFHNSHTWLFETKPKKYVYNFLNCALRMPA